MPTLELHLFKRLTGPKGPLQCTAELSLGQEDREVGQGCQVGDFIAKFSETGKIWTPFG